MANEWRFDSSGIKVRGYRCAHCGKEVAGLPMAASTRDAGRQIHICPLCQKPTYFAGAAQIPAELMGDHVEGLQAHAGIAAIYDEARKAASAGAFTGAVLLCRTLIGHIAEAHGAAKKAPFKAQIEHLINEGVVPRKFHAWIDVIRIAGNEATHDLDVATKEDARKILDLSAMLLRTIYEFDALIPKPPAAPTKS